MSARPPSHATPGSAARTLAVHGWIYGIDNGRLRDLETTVTNFAEARAVHSSALAALA